MRKPSFLRRALPLLLIVLVGAAGYLNTFDAPFVLDDHDYIVGNPLIRDGHYFLEPDAARSIELKKNVHLSWDTRYLGYLSFFLNFRAGGLGVRGFHAANLAIHVTNALLLYLFALLLFRSPALRGSLLIGHRGKVALLAALLFAAHPLQTQAVTYLSQRFASLATMFYLSSAAAYLGFRLETRRGPRYALYALCLALALSAMKTKEIVFTLPVAVVLMELMFFRAGAARRTLYLTPILLTMLVVPMSLPEGMTALSESAHFQEEISRGQYFLTSPRAALTYLRLLLLPVNQNLDYDYPIYDSLTAGSALSLLAILAVLGMTGLLLYRWRDEKPAFRVAAFGSFWFFLTLSVEQSVIPLADMMFEHRAYLPSAGAFLAASTLAMAVAGKLRGGRARALLALLFSLPILLAAASYERNAVWGSPVSLWNDAALKAPKKARTHNNLGIALYHEGRRAEALHHLSIALEIDPSLHLAQLNVGNIFLASGQPERAIEYYRKAIHLKPDYAEAYNNLGTAYRNMGMVEQEIASYQRALGINPDMALVHNNLGLAYMSTGRAKEAVGHFQAALRLMPDFEDARRNLAVARRQLMP